MTDAQLERAMFLRARGASWRTIASELGVCHQLVWSHIHALEGDPSSRKRILASRWHEIALAATDQLADALDAKEISPNQLPIVAGVATDKVALADRWRDPPKSASSEFLGQLSDALAHHAVRITLEAVPAPPQLPTESHDPRVLIREHYRTPNQPVE